MRLRIKRPLFDGEKLHEPPVADVSDLLQPPRDAEVWTGKGYEPVPMNSDKTEVDMEALATMRVDPDPEPEEEDDFEFRPTPKRGKRK